MSRREPPKPKTAIAATDDQPRMTKGEREDLQRLVRQRERVLKSAAMRRRIARTQPACQAAQGQRLAHIAPASRRRCRSTTRPTSPTSQAAAANADKGLSRRGKKGPCHANDNCGARRAQYLRIFARNAFAVWCARRRQSALWARDG
jgi:hypothetical protein